MSLIKVKYQSQNQNKLMKKGDWIDLSLQDDVTLNAGEFKLLSLGVCIKLPPGYEALLIPRSSTFVKYGILQANSIGLIDEDYCDNDIWKFPALATRNIFIPKNTRICQFRLLKHQPNITLKEVDDLSGIDRGGFGSTGE